MVDDELDAMLGGAIAPEPAPLTRAERRRARAEQALVDNEKPELRLEHVMKGVSATWLAKMMRMDLAEVKRRLSVVTPMSGAKNQAKYDLKTAMPHLVDPITDIEEYLKNLDPKDLPPKLSAAFWQGLKVRLQTMEQANQLWPTATVIEAFGEVFKIIRAQTALWVDTIEENKGITDEQRELLNTLIDALSQDILRGMQKFAKERATRSEVVWLEEYADEHGS